MYSINELDKTRKGDSPSIVMENVFVEYKANQILADITFSIEHGEFVYVVGKTGAGKSTLLKTLYGDIAISSGEAFVLGINLEKLTWKTLPKLRRRIGIVSQDYPLLNHLNVVDNVKFALQSAGWRSDRKIQERLKEVLDRVSLISKSKSMPYELSAGERQRIQLARALANGASLVIADEPTANLDPHTSIEMSAILQDINRSFGVTFIVSTNDHDIIRSSPSRIIVIQKGRIKDFATLSDL